VEQEPKLIKDDLPRSTVVRVALDEIATPDVSDHDAIEDMAASIRAVGMLQPVVLVRHVNNSKRFRIVAGRRRIAALLAICKQDENDPAGVHVHAHVFDTLSKAEAAERLLRENANRSDNYLAERDALLTLQAQGLEPKQIAQRLRVNLTWVNRRLSLAALPEPIAQALRRGDVTFTTALQIVRLPAQARTKLARQYEKRRDEDGSARISQETVRASQETGPVLVGPLFPDLRTNTVVAAAHTRREQAWRDVTEWIDQSVQLGGITKNGAQYIKAAIESYGAAREQLGTIQAGERL
jgi:ParB/RepB/Spo0J family partition protein